MIILLILDFIIPYDKLSQKENETKDERNKINELKSIKNLAPMKEYIELLKQTRIRIPYFFQNHD